MLLASLTVYAFAATVAVVVLVAMLLQLRQSPPYRSWETAVTLLGARVHTQAQALTAAKQQLDAARTALQDLEWAAQAQSFQYNGRRWWIVAGPTLAAERFHRPEQPQVTIWAVPLGPLPPANR